MSDDKIDLIKLIQETFSSREKDPNIKSVKIISDALDKCTEEDVNYENSDGETPLSMACEYYDEIYHPTIQRDVLHVIDMLLCSGAKDIDEVYYENIWASAKNRSNDNLANRISNLNIKN